MIEELVSASQALDTALTRYLQVCTNVKSYYTHRTTGVAPQLTARLDVETSSLASFEARLKESHAAIHFARTKQFKQFNSLAPINTLPCEILARIFSIVVSQARHTLERTLHRCEHIGPLSSPELYTALKYPDILAHVCSYWRRTAIHSRSLWAIIDVSTLKLSKMNIRAKEHIGRAGQSLLYLYIYDIEENYSARARVDPLPDMIPSSARIRSLLSHTYYPPSDPILCSVLSSAISKVTAGVLTELVLQQYGWHVDIPAAFIESVGNPPPGDPPVSSIQDNDILWLEVHKQQLENILLGVTILRCYEVYPYWTSQAYYNLTELRLMIPHWTGTGVDEIHLVNMLKSSPNLRVLELNRHITNVSTKVVADRDRIVLDKLEVLSLRWLWNDQTETLLRWLSPASNPLQVSIACDDNEGGAIDFTTSATKAFFTGSNLAKFHTVADAQYEFMIENLLSLNIHTLAVERLSTEDIKLAEVGTGRFQLDTLYLLDGDFDIPWLRELLELISTKRVIFHNSNFDVPSQEVPHALAGVCPNITIMSTEDPNPIVDWELFTPRSGRGDSMS